MTFNKTPLLRRLSRILIVATAALFAVLPAWTIGRAIAAAADAAEGVPASSSSGTCEEEEASEAVVIHRTELEVAGTMDRCVEDAATREVAHRHRMEWDQARVGRRWASYRAPPRAPPHRLLN